MKFLIRYHKTSGNNTYLTTDDTFSKKSGGKLQYFSNLKNAKKHLLLYMENNGAQLLQNRSKNNFEIVNDDGIVVEKPFINTDSVNNTKNDVFNKQGSTLDTIFNELRSHLNHILILDLEFYQDTKENHARMLQIAGIVLGRNSKSPSFNGFIFDPVHMNESQQLDFLKKHDFSYKQALKCSKKAIMNQVGIFIKENKIDNLISWGHSLDYSILENEGYKKLLPGNMKSFDLEEILAQANGNSNNLSLNLEKFCKVLNLNNTGKWHDALDDAKMIKKICELYLNVLVTSPKVKSNLPHLLGSDSTKLSLVAPSED